MVISNSVPSWVQTIRHRYSTDLLNCRIISAEHRKNSGGAEHEYILLTMKCYCNSDNFTRYIRIDRSFRHNPSTVLRHYKTLLRGNALPADDTIIIDPTPFPTGSYSLYKVEFALAPNILDLAALLDAVSSLAPNYDLYRFMCYWHSRILFESLVQAFQGTVEAGEKPEQRGRIGWSDFSISVVDQNGRFRFNRLTRMRQHRLIYPSIPSNVHPFYMPSVSAVVARYIFVHREMMREAGKQRVRLLSWSAR